MTIPFIHEHHFQTGKVSLEEVLALAAKCLAYPGSAATGGALLEGVLGMTPATLFAACLGVVVDSPSSGRRDTLLSMLSRVPMEMLTPAVIAEALTLVTEACTAGKADPIRSPRVITSFDPGTSKHA